MSRQTRAARDASTPPAECRPRGVASTPAEAASGGRNDDGPGRGVAACAREVESCAHFELFFFFRHIFSTPQRRRRIEHRARAPVAIRLSRARASRTHAAIAPGRLGRGAQPTGEGAKEAAAGKDARLFSKDALFPEPAPGSPPPPPLPRHASSAAPAAPAARGTPRGALSVTFSGVFGRDSHRERHCFARGADRDFFARPPSSTHFQESCLGRRRSRRRRRFVRLRVRARARERGRGDRVPQGARRARGVGGGGVSLSLEEAEAFGGGGRRRRRGVAHRRARHLRRGSRAGDVRRHQGNARAFQGVQEGGRVRRLPRREKVLGVADGEGRRQGVA